MIKVKKDLTDKRFGRLLVKERYPEDKIFPSGRACARWKCLCDCGETIITCGWNLTNGDTNSCGCYQKDQARKTETTFKKQYNTYDLNTYDYGVGYTKDGSEFWFDKDDYDLIKNYHWSYNKYGYLVTNSSKEDGQISFHRLVMNAPDDLDVDHIKHPPRSENKFDNRKSNLRFVTDVENGRNHHLSKANTSGVTGVHWNKYKCKWEAYIGYYGECIYLGQFDDKEECIKARKEAEKKYFGEFSFDNSQQINLEECANG